jgi:hypothetical protein
MAHLKIFRPKYNMPDIAKHQSPQKGAKKGEEVDIDKVSRIITNGYT